MFNGIKKALMFAAHTDDEMICAGTLYRLVRSGVDVHMVAFSVAATKEDRKGMITSEKTVIPEWQESMKIIGISETNREYIGFTPSSDLQRYKQDICQIAFDTVEELKPDLVITLSPEDENTAHATVGVETERVMRGRVPIVVRCIFPWNYGLGRPNLFIGLENVDLYAKRKVISAYQSQEFRYENGSMLLNQVIADGLSVKVPAAEKFELVRGVL